MSQGIGRTVKEEKIRGGAGLDIFVRSWVPDGPIRGVVAIVHGVNARLPVV